MLTRSGFSVKDDVVVVAVVQFCELEHSIELKSLDRELTSCSRVDSES